MKKKSLLLSAVAMLGLTAATMAQNVPSYVPTNGLVGWWPFNGNANDASGNGNEGTVNGAVLSSDRFGNQNAAYNFDGNDWILIENQEQFNFNNRFTINAWINTNTVSGTKKIITKLQQCDDSYILQLNEGQIDFQLAQGCGNWISYNNFQNNLLNSWHVLTATFDIDSALVKLYFDGELISEQARDYQVSSSSANLVFGNFFNNSLYPDQLFLGLIDDIGIWNRALNQEEISNLYNATNCWNNSSITPSTNQLETGSTANFIVTTSDLNPSYVWQSNFGQGYQTLNDVENYSGTNTSSLNIANVQLSENNQPIRVITTSGECVDTSNIATISILDTCLTSINDTTFVTVTDTLVINTLITSINPPNNSNTIKVYPNPANSHIIIEYGDFAIMNGYQLKIQNSLGQQVFQTNISQQTDYLSLNNWGGNGLYFVHIIDPQGNTIDIRKIVLQ